MTRETFIIFIGIIVLFVPTFGIPNEWKDYLLIGLGVLIVLIGYSLRHSLFLRSIEQENGERATDSFVESDGTRPKVEVE